MKLLQMVGFQILLFETDLMKYRNKADSPKNLIKTVLSGTTKRIDKREP